jgi:hypothetical protein
MERIKISENFYLDEYIPKELYYSTNNPSDLIKLISPYLIKSDQLLRDHFGPVTINNWWNKGPRHLSGFRTYDCTIGATLSDHKRGMASDKIFKNASSEEVRKYIKENWEALGITKIELGTNWVHSSVAYTGLKKLQMFNQ